MEKYWASRVATSLEIKQCTSFLTRFQTNQTSDAQVVEKQRDCQLSHFPSKILAETNVRRWKSFKITSVSVASSGRRIHLASTETTVRQRTPRAACAVSRAPLRTAHEEHSDSDAASWAKHLLQFNDRLRSFDQLLILARGKILEPAIGVFLADAWNSH